MAKIKKEDYNNVMNLCMRHSWLVPRQNKLLDLIDFCDDKNSKDLIFSLLNRFTYLTSENLNILLNEISEHIVNDSNFKQENCQLLSMTYDDEADSGQKVLDNLKMPLFQNGWRNIKTVNKLGKSIKYYGEGKNQIIVVDEFIGSGKTLRNRINYLNKNIPGDFEVIFCFIAGTKETIEKLQTEGIKVFCPLQLDKGITDFYKDSNLRDAEDLMLNLELKLAQNINDKQLYDYSFGYGKGDPEALFSMEGCNGNTPNSVFPIFWWLNDINNKERNTLLTRYETGF